MRLFAVCGGSFATAFAVATLFNGSLFAIPLLIALALAWGWVGIRWRAWR